MDALLNHMRRIAGEVMGQRAGTKHGIIDGYDPASYAVRVMLQPEGVLTDWIPLKAMMVGNGFGVFMAPTVGEACEVDFQEGDASAGSAGWRFFNNVERPLNVPAGEIWLVHSTGASIKMATSGSITLTDPSGTILQLANNGAMAITGNVTVSGSVTAAGEVTGNGKHLSTHTHSGVTPGGGTSGAPV